MGFEDAEEEAVQELLRATQSDGMVFFSKSWELITHFFWERPSINRYSTLYIHNKYVHI